MRNFKEKLADIEAFVFDVDGVFTNSLITIMPDGEIIRQFNVKDGLALVRAIQRGYKVAIISGGRGNQVRERMLELGVRGEHIYLQSSDKLTDLEEFLMITKTAAENTLYMGDDYPDLLPMQRCGVSVAPSDAADAVREVATYTSGFRGGEGAVRDAIEQVLRARDDWFDTSNTINPH